MADDRLELARQFSQTHPGEAAEVVGGLPREAVAGFLAQLGPEATVTLLNAMLVPDAAAYLAEMPSDKVVAMITQMSPQRAASVLRLLRAGLRRDVLNGQSAVRRSQIQFYLRHAKGIVGAWIESDVVTVRVSEGLDSLRSKFALYQGNVPTAYVVDGEQAVLGTINAAALVAGGGEGLVSALMKPPPEVLRARTPIEIAVTDAAWRKTDILPVVEGAGEFLGVVRYATLRHAVDDLADDLTPEMTGSASSGLADAWFLGLSDLLSASIGRASTATVDAPMQDGDPK